ncbi:MAG: ABC transporter substrate-binding protein [Opitutaceae bacterium]|nr:ABC transporter substrate-binding protein [Opitutaceae bacterium]
MKIFIALICFILITPLYGKLHVVTTTTMITDLVKDIGGGKIEVTGLMGPGVDPHLYKATAGDVRNLQRCEVVFYNGLYLEGRIGDVLVKLARKNKKVYAVTEAIDEIRLLEPPEFAGHFDPHIWFDPILWKDSVDIVVEGLSLSDLENASFYYQEGSRVKKHYEQLNDWAKSQIAKIDPSQRILITSHDAFNYFGRAFGFQVVGVQGISTITEAGLADIAKMVDFIQGNNVRAIFVESSVSPAAINRISQDAGVKVGGELYSDAMGIPGETETRQGDTYDLGTYEGMLKHNIYRIVEALQ